MSAGTKVTIAVVVLFGALLGVYYGFSGPGPEVALPPVPESEAAEPAGETPVYNRPVASDRPADPVPVTALDQGGEGGAGEGEGEIEPGEPWVLRAPNLLATSQPPGVEPSVRPVGASSPTTVVEYVVREDDSLWTIARDQLGDPTLWQAIRDANPQADPNRLQVGQVLRLPGAAPATPPPAPGVAMNRPAAIRGTYVVQSGDTLSSISQARLGAASRWREIYEANRSVLREGPDRLEVGMKLVIPGN